MKKLLLISFSFLLSIISYKYSYSQWQAVKGPYGSTVYSIGSKGSNVFIGTDQGGVFVSGDMGNKWTSVSKGLSNTNGSYDIIDKIKICNIKIYIIINNKIYASVDDGKSWNIDTLGLSKYNSVYSLESDGKNIFLITSKGLFSKTNLEVKWKLKNNGLPSNFVINSLVIKDTNIFINGSKKIYSSDDKGESWILINDKLNLDFYQLYSSGTNIMGSASNGLYISRDNGISWEKDTLGLPKTGYINILAVKDSNIYASHSNDIFDNDGLYLSTDYGQSWNLTKGKGLPQRWIVNALTITDDSNIFAGMGNGVFLSKDNCASWTEVNNDLSINKSPFLLGTYNSKIYTGIYVRNNYVIAGHRPFGGGIFVSPDNGITWNTLSNGFPDRTVVNKVKVIDSVMYAGTNGCGIYKSTDNGMNWTSINYNLIYNDARIIEKYNGSLMLGMGTVDNYIGGIFILNGQSWNQIYDQSPESIVNNGYLYASGYDGVVYSPYGNYWSEINSGLPNEVSVHNLLILCGNNLIDGTNNGIYLAEGSGYSTIWREITEGLPDGINVNTFELKGQDLFAGTNKGIYLSTNNGISWINISDNITNLVINSLLVNGDTLFAGTNGAGIWKRSIANLISGINDMKNIDTDISIIPNPVRDISNIKYQISNRTKVRIDVFDLVGREVAVISNEVKDKGDYTLKYNAVSLKSGIYFLKLQSDDGSRVVKFVKE